jgi:hypothetical protein
VAPVDLLLSSVSSAPLAKQTTRTAAIRTALKTLLVALDFIMIVPFSGQVSSKVEVEDFGKKIRCVGIC